MMVLHVGKYYPPVPGGMERVLQLLCEGERRHVDSRVLVASTDRTTRREVRNGVPVTRAGSLAMLGSVGLSAALPLELRRENPDLTVVHEPNPVALVADFVTRTARAAGGVLPQRGRARRMEVPAAVPAVPSPRARPCSPYHRGVAEPWRSVHEQLAAYRHKCVGDPVRHRHRSARGHAGRPRTRRALRHELGTPLVLFVGRLVPYKGVDVLLRADRHARRVGSSSSGTVRCGQSLDGAGAATPAAAGSRSRVP